MYFTIGCHCNGVVNAIGQFGKCMDVPSGTFCHVNKDSGCKDIIEFQPTVLILAWSISVLGDVAMALWREAVFARMVKILDTHVTDTTGRTL